LLSKRAIIIVLVLLCQYLLCLVSAVVVNLPPPNPSTLQGKVLFGYQGWFGAIGDGDPGYNYWHWSQNNNYPAPNNLAFDCWPDFSEYPSECMYPTNLTYSNGAIPQVFSCFCPEVTDLHFSWLYNYSLDGAILQRFQVELNPSPALIHRNKVAQNVRQSAEKWNRTFCIEYDTSGATPNVQQLQNDWEYLVNNLTLTASPQYQKQNGKPVVFIFGLGLVGNAYTQQDSLAVLSYFHSQGVYVVGGSPYYWREGNQDSQQNFTNVYNTFDALSPWAVGRFGNLQGFNTALQTIVIPDKSYLDAHNQGYGPVIFPGFSWYNLQNHQDPLNQIPRLGGTFFNGQGSGISSVNPLFIFIAMFDEVNEGTAMLKIVPEKTQTPNDAEFVYLNIDGYTMDSDAYLVFAQNLTATFRAKSLQPNFVDGV